jgi:fructose-bisphosphate aldolase, class II
MHRLTTAVPATIRKKLGNSSSVCLLNGADVFSSLKDDPAIVMACNPRIHHVIPGIMRAAEELDAIVTFELTKSEGGLDGGYTGQTPELFASTVIDYAERFKFTRPFVIHADHLTVHDATPQEFAEAERLLEAQLMAGFTSFAIDASFNQLDDNIDIVRRLALLLREEGFGLEVELGEPKAGEKDAPLTSEEETVTFLTGLAQRDVRPLLLSINNGSKRGNYLEGESVSIELELTGAIFHAAREFGVAGLVQHGITGTPLRIVGRLADYGIRKGNIGTLWQNVAHAGFPVELMDEMRRWARSNRRDIKHATGVYKEEIDTIPDENVAMIMEMAYREAKEFLLAFRAKGSATRLAERMEAVA